MTRNIITGLFLAGVAGLSVYAEEPKRNVWVLNVPEVIEEVSTNDTAVTPFSQVCVEAITEQIAMEMNAFYLYKSLEMHFGQQSVALPNTANYFREMQGCELNHADKLINYVQLHGHKVQLPDIQAPNLSDISLVKAFEITLHYEKDIYANLRKLKTIADQEGEFDFSSFIEEQFLSDQVRDEDELIRCITTIKRMGPGLGEQLFDHYLASDN